MGRNARRDGRSVGKYAHRGNRNGAEMKLLTLSGVCVVLMEVGIALVMLNASPHAPLGFWLWFGGIAALSPSAGYWLYRRMTAPEA